MKKTLGIVGARGYVGAELVKLIAGDASLEVVSVSSRALAGQRVEGLDLAYEDLAPEDLLRPDLACVDAWVLALPNGEAARWVTQLRAEAVCVDLSADHRFDDAWVYGLPERHRSSLRGARRIANPGCYATATQLVLLPMLPLIDAAPSVFGVSGWSGAGTTPSPRNDAARLEHSVMPYSLVGHLHEREVARQLARPLHLLPHVAGFARGLSVTASLSLRSSTTAEALREVAERHWQGEPLVRVQEEAPELRDAVGRHHATIGGFAVEDRRAAVVCTLDNLLKGAATQALQNLHLGLGLDELGGLP